MVLALWLCAWVIPSVTAAPGDLDPAYDSGVRPSRIVLQPDGKALLIGAFTEVQGVARNQIARLNADGSLDPTFNPGSGVGPGPNAAIWNLALQSDGKIFISGWFSEVNGASRSGIARLQPDGSLDDSFVPGSLAAVGLPFSYSAVPSFALQPDGRVIIAASDWVVRLNPDGSVDPSFNPYTEFDNGVSGVALLSNGKVLARDVYGIARLNSDGTPDGGYIVGSFMNISFIEVQADGTVLVGASSAGMSIRDTDGNWVTRYAIARLTPEGYLDPSFDAGQVIYFGVGAAALQRDGKLLIGGNFNIQLNGYNESGPYDARYLARLNSDGTFDPTFASNVDFVPFGNTGVGSVAIQKDRKVLIGGSFSSIAAVPRNGMARLAGDVGLTALTPSAAYADGPGFDLAVAGYGFEPGAKVLWNGMDRSTTFVSSTELIATIPSDDLATGVEIAVASVRVQNSDGQLTNPLGFSIVAQTVGTTESAVAEPGESSTVSTAPTTDGDAGVSVTVQNGGEEPVTVLAATYDEEPVGDPAFEVVAGTFVDVQIVGANENVIATVAFYYPSTVTGDAEASLALNYYDGAEWIPVLSSGGVAPTKDTTDNLDGTISGGRFTVTFDMTSTPSILDLGGTVFVMFDTAPQVSTIAGPVGPVALGNPITLTATYGAFGVAEVSLLNFIWGDGTETPVIPGMEGLATATHLYGAPGVYTVTVQVISGEGAVREGRFEYVVIYDPNGGFVTGGGWIHSPAGAYVPDPALSGRATFGFNSKYQRGKSVPGGDTQFQFQAAGFRFHSTAYEWLVVSGAKAQYKGTGQVHGTGDYGFLLTATDGQVSGGGGADRFRIKIWDRGSGLIIYDNALGESDELNNANPQVIGGGSIVIHRSK